MRLFHGWVALSSISLFAWVCAAQQANLSGTWHLNVEKSRYGDMRKPVSVTLTIDHKDPQIEYHGTVTYANEDSRDFAFFGAFDAKPYPMGRSFGNGMITLRRVDPFTFESQFKSDDGNYIETARTSVSKDGKQMTRALRLKSPEGTKSWTEIYERR